MAFLKRSGIMLAYPAEPKRIAAMPIIEGVRRMFHQPKLNGERGRVEWFNGCPYLVSSYGNTFKFIDQILDEIKALTIDFGQALPLDGEVYVHSWSREEIDSALRRTKNKSENSRLLEYHIFDIQDETKPQWERIRILGLIDQAIKRLNLKFLKVVDYGVCTENEWLGHCASYCEDGYEGIILRNPGGFYTLKRSPDLLKFKPTETDLYRIASVNEAIALDGSPKGMVGSFEVYATDEPGNGDTFCVGAGKMRHDERVSLWNRRHELPGKMLLVKHELLTTTNQVPIAAVSVAIME